MADHLSDEPVSFNEIEARNREFTILRNKDNRDFTALRGEHTDLKYEPIRFTGCKPDIRIDKYLSKMGKEPYNKKILELNLSRCQITDVSLLSHFPNLTSLNISWNQLGPEGAYVISGLSNLTSLDITGNMIGNLGALAISKMTGLTSLNISHNDILTPYGGFDRHMSETMIQFLSPTQITQRQKIVEILNSLNISDNGIVEIAANLTNLTSLDITGNMIGIDGAKAISGLTRLTSLDIGENGIGDEGAKAISRLKELTKLNISNNRIGPAGTRYITNSLDKLISLYIYIS